VNERLIAPLSYDVASQSENSWKKVKKRLTGFIEPKCRSLILQLELLKEALE